VGGELAVVLGQRRLPARGALAVLPAPAVDQVPDFGHFFAGQKLGEGEKHGWFLEREGQRGYRAAAWPGHEMTAPDLVNEALIKQVEHVETQRSVRRELVGQS